MAASLQEVTDGGTKMALHSMGEVLVLLVFPGVREVGEGSGLGVQEIRRVMKGWKTRGSREPSAVPRTRRSKRLVSLVSSNSSKTFVEGTNHPFCPQRGRTKGKPAGVFIHPDFWITELKKQRGLRYRLQVPRNGLLESEPSVRTEVKMLDPGQHLKGEGKGVGYVAPSLENDAQVRTRAQLHACTQEGGRGPGGTRAEALWSKGCL